MPPARRRGNESYVSTIRALEARLARLERRASPGTERGRVRIRQTRLMQTTANPADSEDYPDPPANTYWARFVNGDYSPALPGVASDIWTPRQTLGAVLLHVIRGPYLPEGSVVEAFEHDDKWWVDLGTGTPPVRFTLTETIEQGGMAEAQIRTWDEGSMAYVIGATITVHDFANCATDPTATEGLAIELEDRPGVYEILEIIQAGGTIPTPDQAEWLDFQLLSDLFRTDASKEVSVLKTYHGTTFHDPDALDAETRPKIVVYNAKNYTTDGAWPPEAHLEPPYVFEGTRWSVGRARFDTNEDLYYIDWLLCPARPLIPTPPYDTYSSSPPAVNPPPPLIGA